MWKCNSFLWEPYFPRFLFYYPYQNNPFFFYNLRPASYLHRLVFTTFETGDRISISSTERSGQASSFEQLRALLPVFQ